MPFELSRAALAAGYRLEAHETIGSTNARALELAQAGDRGPVWVVSDHQVSGRGRRGRPWQTHKGNLASSLLLADGINLSRAATLGFVAGLALSDALAIAAPQVAMSIGVDGADGKGGRFELKWPNDVLLGGAKLAGILLESAMIDGNRPAVAIGIGVNVVAYPEDTPYPATSLRRQGSAVTAEELFVALSDAWVRNMSLWDGGNGLAEIRRLWLARAAGLGGEVAVRADGRVVRGRFDTIDDECRFVIREDGGQTISIAAGDVHFGAVATAAAD
jgi:BirA family biotin operon repressor/biotin-[acetyl-CoA-carboxylase] ligase